MPRKKAKRSDGRYEIKRKMPDGSTKHFMGYSVTEAVAKYEAARTFKEVAEAYENFLTGSTNPVKRGTINAYRKNIPPFVECFGKMHMAEIDAQAITGYWEKMKVDGKSLHTITNARSVLSCIFRYWCANFHGTGNPVLLSEVPAGMKRGKREEPTEEQCRIIHEHPEGCGFWAKLFEYTGLRMGEANGLRWADVDLEAGFIHVRRAMPWDRNHVYEETLKSENAYRDIPILSPLRPALAEHKPFRHFGAALAVTVRLGMVDVLPSLGAVHSGTDQRQGQRPSKSCAHLLQMAGGCHRPPVPAPVCI